MGYTIRLIGGGEKTFSSRPTALEFAKSLGVSKEALAVKIKGKQGLQDIRSLLEDGDEVEIVDHSFEESLQVIRHSAAHVLAQAVQNLWPDVKVTIGPVIEEGFYYDFDTDRKFTPEDLENIEREMKALLKKKYELIKEVWSSKKALKYFGEKGEALKQEIIRDLNEQEVSVYQQGPWLDLCRGPHVQHLGQIGAVKVLSLSGAYWRGEAQNRQLQRIYGTAFHSKEALQDFLEKREQAKKNDHRVLGKKLDLFWFSELSPGTPFFTASGTAVYRRLQGFLREQYVAWGYEEVITPQIYHADLFKSSGHLKHFADDMYAVSEKSAKTDKAQGKKVPSDGSQTAESPVSIGDSFLKPMNCPGHCLLYKKDRKSYRDLPWRVADFGRLHRNESGGALHGLTRVRSFCQDDAHIFCRLDQLSSEVQAGIKMLKSIYEDLGLSDYTIALSTRPENRMGEDNLWDAAEKALGDSLKALKIPYQLNPGEGAFYGPKLDISVRDWFGRSWQLGTFQCDFSLPEAFGLSYKSEQDKEERPVMVHRAILGSLERFIGVYLEHRKGRLPLWLSPVQAIALPLGEGDIAFAGEIQKKLAQAGIVCKIDKRNEKLSYKIREAQVLQIPYMIVIGKKEAQTGLLSLRLREGKTFSLSMDSLKENLLSEIKTRALDSVFLKSVS